MVGMRDVGARQLVVGLVGAATLALGAACGQSGAPVPIPSPVSKPTVTDTATGTLHVSGNNYFQFQVTNPGEVDVTLTALTTVPVDADPNADPPVVGAPAVPVSFPITLIVGQPALTTLGVSCSDIKSATATPATTPQLTGQALAGNFCVLIADPNGQLPEAVVYTVLVAHP